jgi:hypothetical protein
VRLAPGEVVVVVYALGHCGADDLTHPLYNPFTAYVGIEPAKLDPGLMEGSCSFLSVVVSVDGFEPPISCFQGRQGRPGSPTRC